MEDESAMSEVKEAEEYRVERDSLGDVKVPSWAFFGAQTQRAVDNFPVSGEPMPADFIHALGWIKVAAARVNRELGLLDPERATLIEQAALEVAEGNLDEHFPIDVFQTGSATSSNMNANEVIAHRARVMGGEGGPSIHPNDHVNLGQSSNDVAPSALNISSLMAIERDLLPSLRHLQATLSDKANEFDQVIKSGRTHLMDATPIRLGQEFSGYASQIEHDIERLETAVQDLRELAAGGTAVGTGLNTHAEFGGRIADELTELLDTEFVEARNHFEAQGARDAAVFVSGVLNTVAASLIKIANDIRLLASGPLTGLAEIRLPALQPGSSIMPGKVNPVICESVIQVGAQVAGNNLAVTVAGQWGQLELNTMIPIIARNLLDSTQLLANVCRIFADRAVSGIEANIEQCRDYVERSPSMATALNPLIGYDKAAEIAKRSAKEGIPVRKLAAEMTDLSPEEIEKALDPFRQTEPGSEDGA
jgi:fumarate hydratase class II